MYSSIIVILVSLMFSAFFSGMEIAYVSANKFYIELEKKQGDLRSKILSKLMDKPGKFIATMLVGNNIALVIYGIYMGDLIIEVLFPQYVNSTEYPFWILFIQTIISTLVILITAEFLPKAIFRTYANDLLQAFAIPVYLIYELFSFFKITDFVMWLSDFALRKFFKANTEESKMVFGKVDLEHYISEQIEHLDEKQKGEMDQEIQIFQNALEFSDLKARECWVPRNEVVAVDVNSDLEELRQTFIDTGLSKIIVFNDSVDDVIGYVHSFELFRQPESIRSILLPVEFVPETMAANEVMNQLTRKRKSIAVVLDEYGGTGGIITIEDIVEELFGDIEDEHDRIELLEKKISDTEFEFSARHEVDYINDEYGLALPEKEDYETLGGLIINFTEEIPVEGADIRIENYKFTILEASETKIESVRLEVLNLDD